MARPGRRRHGADAARDASARCRRGTRSSRTGSASSPAPSAPRRSSRPRACGSWPSGSATWWRPTGSASRPRRTRSASPAWPSGAPPSTRRRCAGRRPSTRCWSSGWPPGSRAPCGALGIHQGLAPVLDVVRDLRWGRVEETLGEDPFLVGLVGSAYVRGLESGGRRRDAQALPRLLGLAGRPATWRRSSIGTARARRRDPAAVRDGAARRRAVGDELLHRHRRGARRRRPGAADRRCCATSSASPARSPPTTSRSRSCRRCTGRGRPRRGGRAGARGRDRRRAAVDQRVRRAAARGGRRRDSSTRRSSTARCRRVLQPEVRARPARPGLGAGRAGGRRPRRRRVARARARARAPVGRAARQRRQPAAARRARRSPSSARAPTPSEAMLGCYSFPMHVLVHHPGVEDGVRDPHRARGARRDVRRHLRARLPGARRRGRRHRGRRRGRRRRRGLRRRCSATRPGSSARARRARAATSPTCDLPGRQEELLEALLATGTPVVAVLLVGRPYDLSRQADRLAGLVCGFFPGEEGAQAIADVLSGRVNPSGPAAGQLPRRGLDPALDVPRLAARPAQRGQRGRPDAALRLRARALVRRRHLGRGVRAVGSAVGHRRHLRARGASSRTRPTGTCRRWCRSTCTTGRPRWCARCSSSSARSASTSRPGERRAGAVRPARRPDVVHRPRPGAHRRAGRGRAAGSAPRARTSARCCALELVGSGPEVGVDRALEPVVTVEHRLMHYDCRCDGAGLRSRRCAVPDDLGEFWAAHARAASATRRVVRRASTPGWWPSRRTTSPSPGSTATRSAPGCTCRPRRCGRARCPGVVQYQGYNGGRGLPHEHVFWASAGYAHLVVDTRGQGSGWTTGAHRRPGRAGPAQPGFLTRGDRGPATPTTTGGCTPTPWPRSRCCAATTWSTRLGWPWRAGARAAGSRPPSLPWLPPPWRRCCATCRSSATSGGRPPVAQAEPYLELVRYLAAHRDQVERRSRRCPTSTSPCSAGWPPRRRSGRSR